VLKGGEMLAVSLEEKGMLASLLLTP